MKYGKQTLESTTRFFRIKRRGRKNCRVIWLDTQEEQLLPVVTFEFCSDVEAGVIPETVASPTPNAPLETAPDTAMTGEQLCALMRSYQITTKELAARLGTTTSIVREARSMGLADAESVRLWRDAIETQPEVAPV